ncbi:MAG: hypothetical protein C4B57_00425 [Deltaproteobacteria bacterium]|nr:MAG: hypothetical protein C4B57_00425 [Deltaproteobacteria bacterium]
MRSSQIQDRDLFMKSHSDVSGRSGSPCADPDEMRRWIEYLALEIGPRPYYSPSLLRNVADRLAGNFKSLGYNVDEQLYYYRGEIYYNICASPKAGKMEQGSMPLLVVGAHYDTVPHSPGADDNASGIAGIMELARLISKDPPPGVRLVAFALEEPPVFRTRHMGSFVYASRLKSNKAHVRGMICLDMIGYFSDRPKSQSFPLFFMDRFYPDIGNFIALVGNTKSSKWTKEVIHAFSRGTDLPAERLNAPMIVVGVDFSDHWSFNHFGYPALLVTDTAFYRNRNYHRPSDMPKTLDFHRTAKVIDGLAHVVRTLA